MLNSKLISILKTLSARELNAFEKLVASPFFNVNEDVSALFALLKKEFPAFDEKQIEAYIKNYVSHYQARLEEGWQTPKALDRCRH